MSKKKTHIWTFLTLEMVWCDMEKHAFISYFDVLQCYEVTGMEKTNARTCTEKKWVIQRINCSENGILSFVSLKTTYFTLAKNVSIMCIVLLWLLFRKKSTYLKQRMNEWWKKFIYVTSHYWEFHKNNDDELNKVCCIQNFAEWG